MALLQASDLVPDHIMRSLSLLLFGLTVATAVNGFPGQQPLTSQVATQPIHIMEGWSYEDCGSWTSSSHCYLLNVVRRTVHGSRPDRIYFGFT
jgi:hypothetical protein